VADVLANCVERGDDFVARYGGEEFLVVLPNTSEHGAIHVARKMLESTRALSIDTDNGTADGVTVSIGVISGVTRREWSAMDYINMADKLLYVSKENGRDQYTFEGF
jgi:diguanylate cyclase (GGDEF)-like protein